MKDVTFTLTFLFCFVLVLNAQVSSDASQQQNAQSMLQPNPNIASNNQYVIANNWPVRSGHKHGNGHIHWHGNRNGRWYGNAHGYGNNNCQGPINNQAYGQSNCQNYGWRPVSEASFNTACNSIRHYVFDSDRLMAAKRFAALNFLSVHQVCQIIGLFTFENAKLKFAKFAFKRTYDIQNYYLVYNCLIFNTSRRDLDRYIQQNYN